MKNTTKKLLGIFLVLAVSLNSVNAGAGMSMAVEPMEETTRPGMWKRMTGRVGAMRRRMSQTISQMSPAQRAAALAAMVGLLSAGSYGAYKGVQWYRGPGEDLTEEEKLEMQKAEEEAFEREAELPATLGYEGYLKAARADMVRRKAEAEAREVEHEKSLRQKIRDEQEITEEERMKKLREGEYDVAATVGEIQSALVEMSKFFHTHTAAPESLEMNIESQKRMAEKRLREIAPSTDAATVSVAAIAAGKARATARVTTAGERVAAGMKASEEAIRKAAATWEDVPAATPPAPPTERTKTSEPPARVRINQAIEQAERGGGNERYVGILRELLTKTTATDVDEFVQNAKGQLTGRANKSKRSNLRKYASWMKEEFEAAE